MRLLLLVPLLLLAACGTTQSPTFGTSSPPLPPAAPVVCPPEAHQTLEAEPQYPVGVKASALHSGLVSSLGADKGDQVFQLTTMQLQSWGREGWRRAEVLKLACIRAETK